jgi:hypothetical protein
MSEILAFGFVLALIIYIIANAKRKMNDREIMYGYFRKQKEDAILARLDSIVENSKKSKRKIAEN